MQTTTPTEYSTWDSNNSYSYMVTCKSGICSAPPEPTELDRAIAKANNKMSVYYQPLEMSHPYLSSIVEARAEVKEIITASELSFNILIVCLLLYKVIKYIGGLYHERRIRVIELDDDLLHAKNQLRHERIVKQNELDHEEIMAKVKNEVPKDDL